MQTIDAKPTTSFRPLEKIQDALKPADGGEKEEKKDKILLDVTTEDLHRFEAGASEKPATKQIEEKVQTPEGDEKVKEEEVTQTMETEQPVSESMNEKPETN